MTDAAPLDIRYTKPLKAAEQLRYAIEAAISTADIAPGDVLPAAEDLARSLRVARNNVFKAYKDLGNADLVVAGGRAGTAINRFWVDRTDVIEAARELIELADADNLELPYLQALLAHLWPVPTVTEHIADLEAPTLETFIPATLTPSALGEATREMPWSDADEDDFS